MCNRLKKSTRMSCGVIIKERILLYQEKNMKGILMIYVLSYVSFIIMSEVFNNFLCENISKKLQIFFLPICIQHLISIYKINLNYLLMHKFKNDL